MPSPTVRDVHIETAMSQISIAYRNATYLADKVFPRLKVNKQTDYYFVFDKGAWFRDEVGVRAPGTRASRIDYALTTASYVAVGYALSKGIPDEVRKNSDAPLRPDIEATEFVTDALLRSQERRVATLVTGSTSWGYSASPTTQWSSDTSDPFGDIDAAVNGVMQAIGRAPNVAVMSWDVWRRLKNHPDFLDRIKYVRQSGRVEPNDLAGWFNLDQVLIGTSIYDPAQDGRTASPTQIWGDDLWLAFVPPTPALMSPAAGYILEWEERKVSRFREDQEHQDVIEAGMNAAEVITASDAGAIIYDAV